MEKDDAGGGSRRAGELESDGEVLAPITGRSGTRSEDLQSSDGILVDIAGGGSRRAGELERDGEVLAPITGRSGTRSEDLQSPEGVLVDIAGGNGELDLADVFVAQGAGGSRSRSGKHDLAEDIIANFTGGSGSSGGGDHARAGDFLGQMRGLDDGLQAREAQRVRKIVAAVFGEDNSPEASEGKTTEHCTLDLRHVSLLTEEQENLAVIELGHVVTAPSYAPSPSSGKKIGINADVWQGEFFLREEALSGQKAVDELNEALVDSYNLVSVVLRQKHVSVLLSVIKDSYKDEIDDNSVKTCVSEIRSKCRGLRQEILMLHGTPIREPVEYWRDKYHLASF
ncbi:hypothetical protein EJB05_26469 [Eragrostis curvula]|uniref:Uncharacterized protein n=1 Tax=Eragrostis curvula TaxID=38414 RepID=A0A5J9UJV7_9POAL|nr:hypothetical protein EJB05_26469 [Eragrostis curvula]